MSDYPAVTQQINTILQTPEPAGNMFSKSDLIAPLDTQRDVIVKNLKNDYNTQTNVMTVNKQFTDVIGFFKKVFNVDRNSIKRNNTEIGELQADITDSKLDVDKLGETTPVVQSLIGLVGGVVVLYLFGSVLGSIIHTIAFIILAVGLWHIISTLPNNGQSTISSFFSAISSFFSSLFSSTSSNSTAM